MATSEEKMKPCPWCAQPPKVLRSSADMYRVTCHAETCAAFVYVLAGTEPEAVRLWNTRAEPSP